MRRHTPAVRATGLLLLCLAAVSAVNADPLPARVEQAARERIAAAYNQTIVFGVVNGNQTAVVSFGKLDDGRAPDGDTVYEIGSITKTFTATLLAEEVLSGQTTLDTPVDRLLASFKIPQRDGKKITLQSLAMQVSGLPRMPTNFKLVEPTHPLPDYDAEKLKAFLASYSLPRDPGASYEYSNVGVGLLGYALAQSAHTTYARFLHEKILAPLGMTMSGIRFTEAMRAHLALGHDAEGERAANWDLDALAGAGGLRSTTNDMLRYLRANMGLDETPLLAAMKFAQAPRREVEPKERIGLIWMTTDHGVTWHNGGTGGYMSFIGRTADRLHGVVVLTNTAASVDDLGMATLVPGAPLTVVYKRVALSAAALRAYAGTYQMSPPGQIKIFVGKRGDDLLLQLPGGQPLVPLLPW